MLKTIRSVLQYKFQCLIHHRWADKNISLLSVYNIKNIYLYNFLLIKLVKQIKLEFFLFN